METNRVEEFFLRPTEFMCRKIKRGQCKLKRLTMRVMRADQNFIALLIDGIAMAGERMNKFIGRTGKQEYYQ